MIAMRLVGAEMSGQLATNAELLATVGLYVGAVGTATSRAGKYVRPVTMEVRVAAVCGDVCMLDMRRMQAGARWTRNAASVRVSTAEVLVG